MARVLAALLACAAAAEAGCAYEDSSGAHFDLSGLDDGAPFELREDNSVYYWAGVCGQPVSTSCDSLATAAAATSSSASTDDSEPPCGSTSVLGSTESQSYTLLDTSDPEKGLKLTSRNGMSCATSPSASWEAVFEFNCVDASVARADVLTNVDYDTDNCRATFTFETPEACPSYDDFFSLRAMSWGWYFLIFLCSGLALYTALGVVYKRRVHGASGIEALPNIDFWRDLVEHAQGGYAVLHAKATGRPLQQKHQLLESGSGAGGFDDDDAFVV